jgi:hypothetical protein
LFTLICVIQKCQTYESRVERLWLQGKVGEWMGKGDLDQRAQIFS